MEGAKSGLEDPIEVNQVARLFRGDEGEGLEPSACPAMNRYLGSEVVETETAVITVPHIAPGAH